MAVDAAVHLRQAGRGGHFGEVAEQQVDGVGVVALGPVQEGERAPSFGEFVECGHDALPVGVADALVRASQTVAVVTDTPQRAEAYSSAVRW